MTDSNPVTVLKPGAFATSNIDISNTWPEALLKPGRPEIKINKADIYYRFFGDLWEKPIPIDSNAKIPDTPTDEFAIGTYCTSLLWKNHVKETKGMMAYGLKIGSKTKTIYSLKGAANSVLDEGMLSVDDAMHSSCMLLNTIVDSFYNKNKSYAMTPLGRLAMTDDQIDEVANTMQVTKNHVVKCLNISTARKAYQLVDVTQYASPEMIIASTIRAAYSKNVSSETNKVASSTIKKTVNIGKKIDVDRIAYFLSVMNQGGTGLDFTVDDIKQMAMNKRTAKRMAAIQGSTTATMAFKDNIAEREEV